MLQRELEFLFRYTLYFRCSDVSARSKECCSERLNGVCGYRLVDTALLRFVLCEGTQCWLCGETKIIHKILIEKPESWRVSFGITQI